MVVNCINLIDTFEMFGLDMPMRGIVKNSEDAKLLSEMLLKHSNLIEVAPIVDGGVLHSCATTFSSASGVVNFLNFWANKSHCGKCFKGCFLRSLIGEMLMNFVVYLRLNKIKKIFEIVAYDGVPSIWLAKFICSRRAKKIIEIDPYIGIKEHKVRDLLADVKYMTSAHVSAVCRFFDIAHKICLAENLEILGGDIGFVLMEKTADVKVYPLHFEAQKIGNNCDLHVQQIGNGSVVFVAKSLTLANFSASLIAIAIDKPIIASCIGMPNVNLLSRMLGITSQMSGTRLIVIRCDQSITTHSIIGELEKYHGMINPIVVWELDKNGESIITSGNIIVLRSSVDSMVSKVIEISGIQNNA